MKIFRKAVITVLCSLTLLSSYQPAALAVKESRGSTDSCCFTTCALLTVGCFTGAEALFCKESAELAQTRHELAQTRRELSRAQAELRAQAGFEHVYSDQVICTRVEDIVGKPELDCVRPKSAGHFRDRKFYVCEEKPSGDVKYKKADVKCKTD